MRRYSSTDHLIHSQFVDVRNIFLLQFQSSFNSCFCCCMKKVDSWAGHYGSVSFSFVPIPTITITNNNYNILVCRYFLIFNQHCCCDANKPRSLVKELQNPSLSYETLFQSMPFAFVMFSFLPMQSYNILMCDKSGYFFILTASLSTILVQNRILCRCRRRKTTIKINRKECEEAERTNSRKGNVQKNWNTRMIDSFSNY